MSRCRQNPYCQTSLTGSYMQALSYLNAVGKSLQDEVKPQPDRL